MNLKTAHFYPWCLWSLESTLGDKVPFWDLETELIFILYGQTLGNRKQSNFTVFDVGFMCSMLSLLSFTYS